jgi:hypothetical protein
MTRGPRRALGCSSELSGMKRLATVASMLGAHNESASRTVALAEG